MPDYKKLYYDLFNAATDSAAAIKAQNYGEAYDRLVQAQRDCEETVISEEDDGEK